MTATYATIIDAINCVFFHIFFDCHVFCSLILFIKCFADDKSQENRVGAESFTEGIPAQSAVSERAVCRSLAYLSALPCVVVLVNVGGEPFAFVFAALVRQSLV